VQGLLDNRVPWRLARSIIGHEVTSVIDLGWADLTNGRLLDAMGGQFDILVTVDKGMRFPAKARRPSCRPRTTGSQTCCLLVPALLQVLEQVKPGDVREIY